jgi:hypothetical protein
MTSNAPASRPMTSDAPPADDVPIRATAAPERPRGMIALAIWTLLLILGFGAVLMLGTPLASSEDALTAAYHPTPPVTEAEAVASADTIIRIQYPAMSGAERTVSRRDDLGVDRWVIVYSLKDRLSLVRVSIEVASGDVRVFFLP